MGDDSETRAGSPEGPDTGWEQAREIEQRQPGWIVVYGIYSKEYVAFPLFPAPPGTILTAAYPPALITRMQRAEQRLRGGKSRHRGEP
jgi:hypothetical protein